MVVRVARCAVAVGSPALTVFVQRGTWVPVTAGSQALPACFQYAVEVPGVAGWVSFAAIHTGGVPAQPVATSVPWWVRWFSAAVLLAQALFYRVTDDRAQVPFYPAAGDERAPAVVAGNQAAVSAVAAHGRDTWDNGSGVYRYGDGTSQSNHPISAHQSTGPG